MVNKGLIKILTSHRVLQSCLELEFIFECVFPGLPWVTRLDDCADAKTVVYLEYDLDLELCKRISSNKQLIVYHLGDETAIKDLDSYIYAKAIFRNYYHKSIFLDSRFSDRLYWMPNGFRNGLKNQSRLITKPATDRPVLASFIGWLSNSNSLGNERATFQDVATKCKNLLQCIPTQGFAGGFSPHLYKALLEDAVFAPCPAGNAAETIRLFDALECGCIPITLRHPFLQNANCMPNPPMYFIDRWEDLPKHLNKILEIRNRHPSQLMNMQREINTYWEQIKFQGHLRAILHL